MTSDKNEKELVSEALPLRTWARHADHHCLEDPNDPDYAICQEEIGMSPLHQAAFYGSLKKVKKLIDEDHIDANVVDKYGWRPLHDAAMEGHAEIVKFLLAAGADPNVQDTEEMYTPLHDAVRMNHIEIVRLLLEAGADRSIKDSGDETPLDIAKEYKFQKIIDLLSQ